MALRKINYYDEQFLRRQSKPVKKVDDRIRKLLDDMAETMYNTPNGGGLSACQIGILKRVVVIDMGQGLLKLVNPEIIEVAGEQIGIEGCLSFPGVWGKVKRPAKVVVQALDENGEQITIRAAGPLARCLSHEIDHLDGMVFLDKVIEYVKMS